MAGGIPEATIEEIRARIDLADLIASYGIAVRAAGSSKKACCPFHHEKTPSFSINENKGFYHCFGCGESGTAITFVQKMEGLSFVEAAKKLAGQCGVKIEEKEDPQATRRARLLALLADIAAFYHRCLLKTKEAAHAREYLASRDLDGERAEDYLIGYAPTGCATIRKWAEKYGYTDDELAEAGIIKPPDRPGDDGYHRFGGRLMFSIRDRRGRVVGFSGRQLVASKKSGKYVNSPETPVFKKSNVLYGFDKAASAITRTPNREAIVCEGQIDCIRLQTSGFPNAVAGQGTAFTDEHVAMLKKAADQVALVYDDDEAGHKATIRSARLCLAAELPVRVVSLPGGDDPDSFLRAHPPEDFRILLDGAESIMAFQVRAERAKERNPSSIDAVNRVTREILRTIAACPSAILRASMIAESAELLNLPDIALREGLEKVKSEARPERRGGEAESEDRTEDEAADAGNAVDGAPIPGEDAGEMLPPPRRELAFCELLMACENADEAKEIDGMIGELLPSCVFAHDFTQNFIEVWRNEVASGEDLIVPWGDTLEPRVHVWFDALLVGQNRALAHQLGPIDMAQDFVRAFWCDHLKRLRGELPAAGDATTDATRLKITLDIKRLNSVKWTSVVEIVRDWQQQKSALSK